MLKMTRVNPARCRGMRILSLLPTILALGTSVEYDNLAGSCAMAYIFESTLLVSISKLLDHSAHITPVPLTFKLALPLHPSVAVTARGSQKQNYCPGSANVFKVAGLPLPPVARE